MACGVGFLLMSEVAFAQSSPASQPAPPAAAQAPNLPTAPRLRLSPLLGAALPFGEVESGRAMGDVTPSALLFGFDFAWGPALSWDVGLTMAVAVGLGEPRTCPQPSTSCSLAGGGQFAPRFRFDFAPRQRVSPWLSLGAGLDVLSSTGQSTVSDSNLLFPRSITTERKALYYGPLLLLQAGANLRLRRHLSLGPLLGLALSRYTAVSRSVSVGGEDTSPSSDSIDPSLHAWLYIAANLTFDVRL